MESCDVEYDWQIIGAGGFGVVYLKSNGQAVKAIYSRSACDEAFVELNKQAKIYQLFQNIKQTHNNNRIYNLVKDNIVVSKPGQSCSQPITIDNRNFSCFYSMDLLRGVSISMLENADPESISKLDPEFIAKRGKDFELMVHLSFNTEIPSNIYGVSYSKSNVNDQNPPRGYFINQDASILDVFRSKYGLHLSNTEIKEIIGFIYGILYYYGKIIPIDIEITLGYYDGVFKINVLDFGMTIDVSDLDNVPVTVNTQEIVKILQSPISTFEKEQELIRKIRYNLSVDLYCDVDDDMACNRGWDAARQVAAL